MKQSRFDEIIDRRNSGCYKYDGLKMLYGKSELIPLWVADMDFAVSDEIISALSERLKHPVFGYNLRLDDFYEAITSHDHILPKGTDGFGLKGLTTENCCIPIRM